MRLTVFKQDQHQEREAAALNSNIHVSKSHFCVFLHVPVLLLHMSVFIFYNGQ